MNEKRETGPHVYRAMCAVKKKLSSMGITKDRAAPAAAGGFRFRGIDDVYNVLCGLEADEGLLVFPRIVTERTEYQQTDKGKIQTHVHLTMELKFVSAVDGSSETASALGEGIDSSDKASGKAQSNAMKQAHLEVYKVPTEGDNDIENHAEQVGPSLERQLSASVEWAEWEKAQAMALRSCRSMGELQECWAQVYDKGQRSPNGTMKRLGAVKDDCKAALSPRNGASVAP